MKDEDQSRKMKPGTRYESRGHGDNRDMDQCLQLLTHDTSDATAELYTNVFLNDEPMTRRHGVTHAQFLPHAREYLHICADQKVSVISIDPRTSEVTAFLLGSDLTFGWHSAGPGIVALLTLFRESMAIIEELESRCPDLAHIRPGMVLHLFQAGAHREYRKQGLVTRLMECSLAHAQRRGYVKAIAECTGPVSRHAFEKCGFSCAAYIAYDAFRHDGNVFFSGLPGGISLMIRDI